MFTTSFVFQQVCMSLSKSGSCTSAIVAYVCFSRIVFFLIRPLFYQLNCFILFIKGQFVADYTVSVFVNVEDRTVAYNCGTIFLHSLSFELIFILRLLIYKGLNVFFHFFLNFVIGLLNFQLFYEVVKAIVVCTSLVIICAFPLSNIQDMLNLVKD